MMALFIFFQGKGCQTIGIEPTNSFEEAKKMQTL